MGLDWTPCRVEPNVDPGDAVRAVEQEAVRFRALSGYLDLELYPLVDRNPFSESIDARNEVFAEATGERVDRLSDLLLLKPYHAHRVAVVGSNEIFPLPWRLDAYRTILPDELPAKFDQWTAYRQAVAAGKHRRYLNDVLLYHCTVRLGRCATESALYAGQSADTTASWAQRPEVIEARSALLELPAPEIPAVPVWDPSSDDSELPATATERWLDLHRATNELTLLIDDWNRAARRGNWKFTRPPEIPALEDWIATWISNDWFDRFAEWLQPWLSGGYGLYRECE